MAKILKIESCRECKHRRLDHCMHPAILYSSATKYGILYRIDEFPTWCPLEDTDVCWGSAQEISRRIGHGMSD